MTDMNDTIFDSNWELFRANGINDLGQVVGQGFLKGVETPFLVTPPLNTIVGTDQIVVLDGSASVQFATVTYPGDTVVSLNHPAIAPPSEFLLAIRPSYTAGTTARSTRR